MAKTRGVDVVGKWAFLIGVILAVVLGLFDPVMGNWAIVLVIIGLIVGLLNVTDKEVAPFLMSGAVLIIASALGGSLMSDMPYVGAVLDALLAVFVPATVIVAIKNVFSLARN
ncbi:MAG TPA: hypothetical protein VJA20_03560 [Candidatus Nanoarchaeia archaeon]|nr:hypothetical protein [Candidatus Nanoarchaeia archaeon]